MPTTLTGLLLLVLLLLPGIAYVAVRERATPEQRRSPFRETAAVVAAGVVADLVALLLVLLTARLWPQATLDIGALIRDTPGYVHAHYTLIVLWAAGFVAVAAGIAAGGALLLGRGSPHPSTMSSWWTLFDYWHPGTVRHIQCELDDGTCITGQLGDWNTTATDTPDRDLILAAPITYRRAGSTEYHPHPVSVVCISARHIVAMFVAYSDPVTSPAAEVAVAGVAASSGESAQVVGPGSPPAPTV